MALNHVDNSVRSGQLYSGSVAELLIDEDGKLIDYSLNYPHFKHIRKKGEKIQYGIYRLHPEDSDEDEINEIRFDSANEAEDYLLDQFDFNQVVEFKPIKKSKLEGVERR